MEVAGVAGKWANDKGVYYLVNKPLPATSISEDNACGWQIVRGQSIMPTPLSNLQDNLSAKGIIILYTASQKGVYLLYSPLIIFYISKMLGEKKIIKKRKEVSARANDANKYIDCLIFVFFKLWLDRDFFFFFFSFFFF